MSQINSRRQFMKIALGVGGLLAFASPTLMAAEERRRAQPTGGAGGAGDLGLPLVKPGEGMAANLKYVHNHKDLKDASLKVERQATPFAKQHCKNCMLYTKVGNKDGAEVGKCTLFNGMLVKSEGWCQSWSKKA